MNQEKFAIYMVKNHEDAYWQILLLNMTITEARKNNKYGKNWLLWFIHMSGEYCRIIFV